MINNTAAFLQVTSLKVIHIHSYFHDQGIGNNNEFDKKKKKNKHLQHQVINWHVSFKQCHLQPNI